jgi:hypothetical protein
VNGGCFVSGTPVLMANRSTRAIEHLKPGDAILTRDPVTGHLTSDVIVKNHSSKASATVVLELSNGKVLETSMRQPFVLHDGRLAKAWDIARRARVKTHKSEKEVGPGHKRKGKRTLHWREIPSPIRLRTHTEKEIHIVSSRIVKGNRTVYCIQMQRAKMAFMRDAEVSTSTEDKIE